MSWLKWLVRTAASAIVISLITLYTTWYIVSLIATNLFEQLHLPANLIPRVQFSDVIGGVLGGDKKQNDKQTALDGTGPDTDQVGKAPDTDQIGTGGGIGGGTGGGIGSGIGEGTGRGIGGGTGSGIDGGTGSGIGGGTGGGIDTETGSGPGSGAASGGIVPNMETDEDEDLSAGESSGENVSPEIWGDAQEVWKQERKVIISAEDVSRIRDEMSDEDKMRLFSLLAYKLPESEVQKISTMMERGLTEEEALEIQDRLKLYLTEQEYEELLTLLTQ